LPAPAGRQTRGAEGPRASIRAWPRQA
jgi:hypothetical protein